MGFIDLMKETNSQRKTFTENGAIAYATTGKELLDFNFRLSGFRKMDTEDIQCEFSRVYFEDPLTAVKFLFWIGDVKNGAGERKVFRSGLLWLAKNKPDVMRALIPWVPEYNRFDSLLPLLNTDIRKDVSSLYKKRIELDVDLMNCNSHSVSLSGKWAPSANASSEKTKRYARMLIEDFGWTPAKYRKTLSALRKYTDVVEVKMSAKEWGEIDYSKVPSKANLNYSNAFLRNDENRRRRYLESLKRGAAKINAGVLQPHEIVNKYSNDRDDRFYSWRNIIGDYDETLEQLWNNLPNQTIENCLVIRDGSWSMTDRISGNTTCLDVATALSIYMAERNSGEWKNKFITFSSRPEIVDISNCKTLHDKLKYTYSFNDCSNTDIYKTMMLILNTAINNHVSQKEMPQMICICSDMEFDGRMFNLNKTLFEDIIEEFEAYDYKMPKICFWNINGRGGCSIPVQQNKLGLILCSGFSTQIMKMFMSNKLDPLGILLETINSERYKPIETAVKDLV